MRLHPFRALRPRPEVADQVAAVPYDVVNRAEAAELARGNPRSFLHVGRSDIDLPQEVDAYDPRIYLRAREALDQFVLEGTLLRDEAPALYLYRQTMDGREQVGVVGCVHVDDYERDLIRKHEKTRPDKEDDRTRHVLALNANAEPVFLTYRQRPDIDALVARETAGRHRCTTSPRPTGCGTRSGGSPRRAGLARAFEPVPHSLRGRRAPPLRQRVARRPRSSGTNSRHRGDEEYNWFLAVLFPADAAPHPALQPGGARPERPHAGRGARAARRRRARCSRPRAPSPTAAGRLRRLSGRPLVPAGAGPAPPSTGAIRSPRSTWRCCRTACWRRSSASATRAPTSGSTSWAGSGARRSWPGGWTRARWPSPSRCTPPRWSSSWRCRMPGR